MSEISFEDSPLRIATGDFEEMLEKVENRITDVENLIRFFKRRKNKNTTKLFLKKKLLIKYRDELLENYQEECLLDIM